MSPRVSLRTGRGVIGSAPDVGLILPRVTLPCRRESLIVSEFVRSDASVREITRVQRIGYPLRTVGRLVEAERIVALRCVGRQGFVREIDIVGVLSRCGQFGPAGVLGYSRFGSRGRVRGRIISSPARGSVIN